MCADKYATYGAERVIMERFCDKCGTLVSGEGMFCPNCGSVLPGAVSLNKPASSENPSTNSGEAYPGGQQTYNQVPPNQSQMPVYPQNYNMGNTQEYEPMSVGAWIGTIFLMVVPMIGLIFLFIWAFDSSTKQPKKNFARAYLLIMAISIGLSILLSIMGFGMIGCLSGGFLSDLMDYGTQLSGLM